MEVLIGEKKEQEKTLEALERECLKFCYQHPLYKKGTYPVFGKGCAFAKIMFVGEAPGYYESISGRPFCGKAGRVLDELLYSVGLKREEIYITNLIKLRPPNNRDPLPSEIEEFAPFLEKQIDIINPKIICPLGRYSMKFLMTKFGFEKDIQPISKIHGKMFKKDDRAKIIIPFYHPAVAVYNPQMKKILLQDFQILKKYK